MIEHLLDARGLNCPLPILKAGRALNRLQVGDALRVLSTDPVSAADFEDFCRAAGAELVEAKEDGGTYSFLIRRLA